MENVSEDEHQVTTSVPHDFESGSRENRPSALRVRGNIGIDSVSRRPYHLGTFPFLNRPDPMEADMAKYLFQVSYTAQGAKGLLDGGGSKRRAAADQAAKSVGGKIESFYFAFGDSDAFVIADMPDHASASAVSLAVGASGGAHCKTIVLMTPEEVDQASKKPLTYTGPGR